MSTGPARRRPRRQVLRVDAVHRDVPFDGSVTAAVGDEIEDLAAWLGLDLARPTSSR